MLYSPLSFLLGFLLFCFMRVASADLLLNFGVYTSEKPYDVVKQFRPILSEIEAAMTDRLGERVVIKMNVSPNYSDGIDALVSGGVDFARFGPASYILAKARAPDIEILALENDGGDKVFYGVICVRAASSIQTIADLRGRSFAFGDENSTIGRYLSQQLLLDNRIRASDLARYDYLGRHDAVGAAVAMGRFDAGALAELAFQKLVKQGDDLRVIARIPNVTKPWIVRAGLPVQFTRVLRDVLVSMRPGSPGLAALHKDGFLFGTDGDFLAVRRAFDNNSAFFVK